MVKIYSDLFYKVPVEQNRKVKNYKLRFCLHFAGAMLCTAYVFLRGGFGIRFHWYALRKAISSFYKKRIDVGLFSRVTIAPLDSFRYFEFHFCGLALDKLRIEHYLDISSPRLFPARIIEKKGLRKAVLINPDKKDLETTRLVYSHFGIDNDVCFIDDLIENAALEVESFDVISSISVLEHIPLENIELCVKQINALLKPGGYLLITVPVCREPFDEYINLNEYGLQVESEDGYYFGQRFHDQKLLDLYYNKHLGEPIVTKIVGERERGFFIKNRFQKLNDINYPHWKESLIFFKNYKKFKNISELPGIGVAMLLYQKKRIDENRSS